jgi:hypothetical protein
VFISIDITNTSTGILFKDKGSNGTILFYPCSKEPVKMIDMTL